MAIDSRLSKSMYAVKYRRDTLSFAEEGQCSDRNDLAGRR